MRVMRVMVSIYAGKIIPNLSRLKTSPAFPASPAKGRMRNPPFFTAHASLLAHLPSWIRTSPRQAGEHTGFRVRYQRGNTNE